MDVAIGLLKIYMKHGVIAESALIPLFEYFFDSFPELSGCLEKRIDIFLDVTQMKKETDYPETWFCLGFPLDDVTGMPVHPSWSEKDEESERVASQSQSE